MKTPTAKPTPAKLPGAKLCDIYLCEDRKTIRAISPGHSTAGAPEAEQSIIGVVTPCHSIRAARALLRRERFFAMGEAERAHDIASLLIGHPIGVPEENSTGEAKWAYGMARAILEMIHQGQVDKPKRR